MSTWVEGTVVNLRQWTDELYSVQVEADIAAFAAGGQRWWKAFNEGDERTKGFGIVALGDEESGDENTSG